MANWRNPEVTREDAENLCLLLRGRYRKEFREYPGVEDVYWHAMWSLTRAQLQHGVQMLKILNPVHCPGPVQFWHLACGHRVDFDTRKGNKAAGTSLKERASALGPRYELPALKADFS